MGGRGKRTVAVNLDHLISKMSNLLNLLKAACQVI